MSLYEKPITVFDEHTSLSFSMVGSRGLTIRFFEIACRFIPLGRLGMPLEDQRAMGAFVSKAVYNRHIALIDQFLSDESP